MTEQDKVTVDDIIGIVKTEEQTNSVEEVRKLRGRGNKTAKRFTDVWCSETGHIGITDKGIDKEFTGSKFKEFLNELSEENEQLKSFIKKLTNHNGEILLMNGYGYTKSYVERLLE